MARGKRNAKKSLTIPTQRGLGGGKHVADPGVLLPRWHGSEDRICWRFGHVDDDSEWGLACLGEQELANLITAMTQFESQTIHELFHAGELPGKCHDVSTLPSKAARARLVEMGLSDQTKIWKLRIGGPGRLWGFLSKNVFHVVWWDPKHAIWPTKR